MTEKLIGADNCTNCKFMSPEGTQQFCRRFPPTPQIVMTMTPKGPQPTGTLAAFPPVQSGQWCGEHRRALAVSMQ